MKRILAVMLLLAVLLPACALGEMRVVLNPGEWNERLNLREKPDQSSASLGRFYTGTRVWVMEDLGEWYHVRIAMGTGGQRLNGYMMKKYLYDIGGNEMAGLQPYMTLKEDSCFVDADNLDAGIGTPEAGRGVYVLGYCGDRVYALSTNGTAGFVRLEVLDGELHEPEENEKMQKIRMATGEAGATLHLFEGQAKLYGGVFIDDLWLMGRDGPAIAFLGDAQDAASGMIDRSELTWTDNGANCGCFYPVYQQDGRLVEVLGEMDDGMLIVRRTDDQDGSKTVGFERLSDLEGAVRLEGEAGSTSFFYTEPMHGEIPDDVAIACAVDALTRNQNDDEATGEPLTIESLSQMKAIVRRVVQPQWSGFTMLFVEFTDEDGVRRAFVELDPSSGALAAIGDNG